ncbi:LOW QUALITY PROTEIN: spatacsin [Sitophilus oryzae]|uniref:LOW QUALITY PROTEIN: spatacsin n=1 Tax=Sitophilus oryzae TaxID=7048 RepID=A0A6J2XP85_SITOR|nr:LOW QUALITY PROTEIN: spatacsin [Sitophilus oryzae]
MHNIRYRKYIKTQCSSATCLEESSVIIDSCKEPIVLQKELVVSHHVKLNLYPSAPPNISKENLSLWIGWTYKNDKEVIREAALKGHVPLAEKFLLAKNNVPIEEVKDCIKKEVLIWVDELLDRKLIFRVSSILHAIDLDPVHELQKVFYTTKIKDLREYIGSHLRKINKLPCDYEKLWIFLEILTQSKGVSSSDESIEGLDHKSGSWKEETAAKLFIDTHDKRLAPLITAEVVWDQLLLQNQADMLISWIRITYSPTLPTNLSISEDLVLVLQSLPISEQFLNKILPSNLSSENKERILNELAKFGVFVGEERHDICQILSRINCADNIVDVYAILNQNPSSNIDLSSFFELLIDYCSKNNLLVVLNSCLKNFDIAILKGCDELSHFRLITDFRNLVKSFQEKDLCDNIFNVSVYLSGDNLEKYFCDNSLVFLSLLVFSENVSVQKTLAEKSLILYNVDLYRPLTNLFESTTFLGDLYRRKINKVTCNLTYFDLLKKHHELDPTKIFSYKFENKPLPNFNSFSSEQCEVYSKKINYTFYLKLSRPSMASKCFFLDILKGNIVINDEIKMIAREKVYKIAVSSFDNISLTTSCVSFLEMIGISSEFLRVNLEAANVLFRSNPEFEIVSMFLNAEKNSRLIQALLDETIVENIDFTKMTVSGKEFVQASKLYEIVIKFSDLHQLPLPDLFLTNLSQHNLWYPFLLYAQMKNYPVDQIKTLCSNFKNPSLLEHIVHSVMHDIKVNEANVLMGERDSRSYFLSKLGVRKMLEAVSEKDSLYSRSTYSGASFESNLSSFESDNLEIDITNTKVTLLQILIRCHNSTDPPKALLQACYFYKNPLLAILATSYEPDSFITNWLTWLCVSTNLYEAFSNLETNLTNANFVSNLLNKCMINRYPRSLLESLIVFLPGNPLTLFLDFLNSLINKIDHLEYLVPKLMRFKSLNTARRASVISQTDYEMTYLKNRIWIENTAVQLLYSAIIYNSNSYFEQIEYMSVLCQINIKQYFVSEICDFIILYDILELLFDTTIKLNIAHYLEETNRDEEVQDCINKLLKQELFDKALKISRVCNFDTNLIVLKKWENKYRHNNSSIQEFLRLCNEDFIKEKLSADCAISFFNERTPANDVERYFLLKSSHKWALDHDLTDKYELERKKILAFIDFPENVLPIDELTLFENHNGHITYKEMLKLLEKVYPAQQCVASDSMDKLDSLLAKFLDRGNFWMAVKLEKIFGCDNTNTDILKLCHELAEDIVSPTQLNEYHKQLFFKFKEFPRLSYRRNLTFRNVSVSSDKNYLEMIQENDFNNPLSQDTLILIHALVENLTHGVDLGYNIFMKYRICRNIELPYDIIVSSTDHINMLKCALQEDCANKLDVVHDFLKVFHWTKDQINDFVCEQFVNSASNYSKSKTASYIMWDVRMDTNFDVILKLLKDECYTLGYKLYNYAVAVHEQQVTAELNFKISEMSLVVELLIAAHSCFTTDCNMEGISVILRKCRTVISHLLTVRSWKLIVRLFTGVARYTELNFVFDILKENHQFEFLLSKGSKRDNQLRQASFEYLKKHCPEDKELYRLVAIHFNMCSEIASVYEREGLAHIKQLVSVIKTDPVNAACATDNQQLSLIGKNETSSLLLHKALDCYVLAAEYHVEGQKLAKGMAAAKQAELIALQKSLLNPLNPNEQAICLFDLNTAQIASLISTKFNFYQSNIITEAYNYIPDWPTVIFEQTIKENRLDYFDAFMENIGINEQFVQEVSRKYSTSNLKGVMCHKNMAYIIASLKSIHVKYRLASELGFTDLVEELISTGQISYLRDTVWKKGYKS